MVGWLKKTLCLWLLEGNWERKKKGFGLFVSVCLLLIYAWCWSSLCFCCVFFFFCTVLHQSTSACLCWAGHTQRLKAGTMKFDILLRLLPAPLQVDTRLRDNHWKKKKKGKTTRLEKLDPRVVWTPSSSWRPHRQKWMGFFWTGREESCHCHFVYAVSDAAIWTWGWGINLHPRAGLDILFPDGAPPAVDSAPKGPGIPESPIHHRRTRPLILGAEAPLGSTCPRVSTLAAKTTPPHPSALHPPLLPWGVRGRLRVWDNFACPETLV